MRKKVSQDISFSVILRNHPYQGGLQLIHSNPFKRSGLIEINSSTVKTMKNSHEEAEDRSSLM